MKKSLILINLSLILSIMVFDILYMKFGSTWQKAVASILFVILAVVNLIYNFKVKNKKDKFGIILLIGLVFAMLGDIVLNFVFVAGAALFAIGHVFFFISYCVISKFKLKDFLYGLAIFIPSLLFILLAPIFNFDSVVMEMTCIIYALIISLMVGKALSNLINNRSCQTILILIGSILFFISDLMLLLNNFGGLPKFVDYLCLITYYPAEIILALSILFSDFVKRTNKKE